MWPILAGTEQLDPNSGTKARLTKGIWNFALSPAYTKSQCVSMVVPPPTAAPCTAAISGLSKSVRAFISRACGDSPGPGGFFRTSSTSLPAHNESPAPCQSTTRIPSSVAASLKRSARVAYMLEVIAFFFSGRFNSTRRMPPERWVIISLIVRFLCSPRSDGCRRRLGRLRYDQKLRRLFPCSRDGAARTQVVDLLCIEPQFFENLLVVFSKFRGAPCCYLGDTVHLNRAADRSLEVSTGAIQRNDNVVFPQLRVIDDFAGRLDNPERDVGMIED